MSLMIYFVSINFIAFLLCFIDKRKAIRGSFRISEATLLFVSFLGGCFGMSIGMSLFHHKTHKIKFKLVYFFDFVWLGIYLYVFCYM